MLRFVFCGVVCLGIAAAQMPSWLKVGGEYRARFEGFDGGGFREGTEDAYLLHRVRINLGIQPADWLKFFFQGQDSRVWGNDLVPRLPSYENPLDLRQGYVELGDPESTRVALRLGRQELNFGDQRLVGSSNWTNTARTFDAVRLTLRHGWLRLDAFAASVVVMNRNAFDRPSTGNNLHGAQLSTGRLIPSTTVEFYDFWRVAPGRIDFHTAGTRWTGRLARGFDFNIEMAAQTGMRGADSVLAFGGHWNFGHRVAAPWNPRLYAEYNYATGDGDPRDGRYSTFELLYPTGHNKTGLADQVGWKNIHDVRLGTELRPWPKWLFDLTWHNYWLADPHDGLYNSGGALVVRRSDGTAGARVGQELDLQALYSPVKPMQVGAGLGHLFPGEFLMNAAPGHAYTFPYVFFGYTF